MSILYPHRFNPERITCQPADDGFRKAHFNIHRAINMTSLNCVLADMEAKGLPKEQSAAFKAAADALLCLITTENNRLYNF